MKRHAPALLVVLACAAVAHADGPPSEADRLFDEGKQAMLAADYPTACARFAASLRLEPGIGTRLWLADCYEKSGRLASAWRVFREAAAAAIEADDSRAQVAASRAAQLEPKLARLILRVTDEPKGLEIRLDGVKLPREQWSVPIFVDRGRHEVRASAPGRPNVDRVVDVEHDGKSHPVDLAFEASVDRPPSIPTVPTVWPTVGWSLVAAGAVSVGVGSWLGLRAKSRYDDAAPRCPSTCDAEGYDARRDAFRTATASTIVFVAGGVLAATGVAVLVAAPSRTTKTTGASFSLRVAAGSLTLEGAF